MSMSEGVFYKLLVLSKTKIFSSQRQIFSLKVTNESSRRLKSSCCLFEHRYKKHAVGGPSSAESSYHRTCEQFLLPQQRCYTETTSFNIVVPSVAHYHQPQCLCTTDKSLCQCSCHLKCQHLCVILCTTSDTVIVTTPSLPG